MQITKQIVYFQESENLALSLAKKTGFSAFVLERVNYTFGEFSIVNPANVKDAILYFVVQINTNPSERYFEIMFALDALERSGAKEVHLVLPYLPFSRQDKQISPTRAVASQVVARMLESAKFTSLIAFDLHNDTIKSFFTRPLVHLSMLDSFITYFNRLSLENVVIVAPDYGRFAAAKYVQKSFNGAGLVAINKRRGSDGSVFVEGIEGDVSGKTALIIEDIIDTGNTLEKAITALRLAGVSKVYVAATHGVFSGDALKKLKVLNIEKIVISNTIPLDIIDSLVEIINLDDYLAAHLLA